MKPFFSIGVTTYDRFDLLKETILSVLWQSFEDFELLIGNDNTGRVIDAETLDIEDKRIRYINHENNMGAMPNMNSLLKESNGKYFTWLSDDDMFFPTYLERIHLTIKDYSSLECIFTSYIKGKDYPDHVSIANTKPMILSGHEWLRKYLNHDVKTQGCYGMFKKQYLQGLGGMRQLGASWFSPYSDNLLAIEAGSLATVCYIENPLMFYRAHEGSASAVGTDIDAYGSAQKSLMVKCIDVFVTKTLIGDFDRNLFLLLKWLIKDFVYVVWRAGYISMKQVLAYLIFLKSNMKLVKNPFLIWSIMLCLIWAIVWEALLFAKHKAKLAGLLCK